MSTFLHVRSSPKKQLNGRERETFHGARLKQRRPATDVRSVDVSSAFDEQLDDWERLVLDCVNQWRPANGVHLVDISPFLFEQPGDRDMSIFARHVQRNEPPAAVVYESSLLDQKVGHCAMPVLTRVGQRRSAVAIYSVDVVARGDPPPDFFEIPALGCLVQGHCCAAAGVIFRLNARDLAGSRVGT
jgi:hypothetical protein